MLTEWDVQGEAAEPALLVLTELLSNAVEHARPPLRLTLRLGRDYVRVEVHDTGAEPPCFRGQEADGSGGHGVQIIAALAARHGWNPDSRARRCGPTFPSAGPTPRCPIPARPIPRGR